MEEFLEKERFDGEQDGERPKQHEVKHALNAPAEQEKKAAALPTDPEDE